MPRVPSSSLTWLCRCSHNVACNRSCRPLLRHAITSTQCCPVRQIARFYSDPRVHVESLDKTLDAHREHNRSRTCRYDPSGPSGPSSPRHTPKETYVYRPRGLKDSSPEPSPEPSPEHDTPSQLRSSHKDKAAAQRARRLQANAGRFADHTFQWKPMVDRNCPLTMLLPWLSHQEPRKDAYATAIDYVTEEIHAFDRYTTLNSDEQSAAEMALQDLKTVVKDFDQHLEVDVIGSRATDIADPLSDLDANVWLPEDFSSSKPHMTSDHIIDALQAKIDNWQSTHQGLPCPIELIFHVRKAVVPILSCRHPPTGLSIQIQSTPRTVDSTPWVTSVINEFPTLPALFKVLRQTLLIRGLNDGARGGLTSYPLLNMIVASLSMSEHKTPADNAGMQLMDFLNMYCEIDLNKSGVSIRPLGYFPKQEFAEENSIAALDPHTADLYWEELEGQAVIRRRAKRFNHILAFQDPLDPVNNIGRKATRMRDVQETLIRLRHQLQLSIRVWDASRNYYGDFQDFRHEAKSLGRDASLLKVLLEADYRIYEHKRRALTKAFRKTSSIGNPVATLDLEEFRTVLNPGGLVGEHPTPTAETAGSGDSGPKISDTLVAQWDEMLGDMFHRDGANKHRQDDNSTPDLADPSKSNNVATKQVNKKGGLRPNAQSRRRT
ncbi:hypothetical protein PV10_00597 [Exophiala mesophila]|uniref:Polynucleotide adenylyltransferase n=1 Tax=Exophiala mesophila TaxID=212818 RepID=A0A0D1Y7N6_EXOME|nr:uncharacterized protein PV10_00597 [Exophiala mesophila]KIV96776.1 hypothetical protein PV10_00597 [Exophiala mesophila]